MFSQRILFSVAVTLLVPAGIRADSAAELLQKLDAAKGGERAALVLKIGNLGRAAAEAVPVLENLLHSPNEDLANQAARSLAQIGVPALEALAVAARHEDGVVSLRALWAVSLMGPDAKEAIPDLVKLLEHPHERIRGAALYALGEIGPEVRHATSDIVKQIRTPSPLVRYNAVLALGKIGTVAIDDLRELLTDKSPEVRADAARALRLFGKQSVVALPDLDEAIKDRSEEVRAAAALAIGGMEKAAHDRLPQMVELLLDPDYEVQAAALEASLSVGAGDPRLMDGLRDANRKGKWATPFLLKQFGKDPGDAVPHLVKAIQGTDTMSRIGAAYALGQIGAPARSAVPALQRAAKDTSPQVRALAVVALQQINQEIVTDNHPLFRQLEQQMDALQQAHPGFAGREKESRTAFQAALRNVPAQRYYDSLAQLHVSVSVGKVGVRRGANGEVIKMLVSAGPAALPALVKAVNMSANLNIGFS